jgi:hypothetical protein
MLLKNFLPYAIDFINQHKARIQEYAKQLKTSGNYKNYDLRLAFDLFYYQQAIIKKAGNYDFDLLEYIANICNVDKNKIQEGAIFTLYKRAINQANIDIN